MDFLGVASFFLPTAVGVRGIGAQGGGGVAVPGGVQKPCRHGTSRHGLVAMGVLS